MRLAEATGPAADRDGCGVLVRPPIGRQGMAAVAGALLGAATLCAPAEAQNATSDISARIESTFNLVIGNAADLAIPLTRRALARRFSEDATEPSVARAVRGHG